MVALQGALMARFGVGGAFRITLAANAVVAIGVFVAYSIHEDATVAFTAYVIYSVAFEMVMLGFWSFISQHFKDLANEQGRALLGNSVLRLCLQDDRDDLEYGRDTIGLTGTDIEQITTLPKQEGLYSTVYVVSRRGRGAVRISLAALEYWVCSSDPEYDQPCRAEALRDAGGDPWEAQRLLCTPEWHERYRDRHAA